MPQISPESQTLCRWSNPGIEGSRILEKTRFTSWPRSRTATDPLAVQTSPHLWAKSWQLFRGDTQRSRLLTANNLVVFFPAYPTRELCHELETEHLDVCCKEFRKSLSLLDWEHEMLALQTTDLEAEWMGAPEDLRAWENHLAISWDMSRIEEEIGGINNQCDGFLGNDAGQEVVHQLGFSLLLDLWKTFF